jgi:hypothetical protein
VEKLLAWWDGLKSGATAFCYERGRVKGAFDLIDN